MNFNIGLFFKIRECCNHPCQGIVVQKHIGFPIRHNHGDHDGRNCSAANIHLHDGWCVRRNCTLGGSDRLTDNLMQLECWSREEFHSRVCRKDFPQ